MPQPTLRRKFLDEINKELSMRAKVWQRVCDREANKYIFVDHEHQRRYDILKSLGDMLDLMTDPELNKIFERVERARAQTPPETLF